MDADNYTAYYTSPIGQLRICGTNRSITAIVFTEDKGITDVVLPQPLQACLQQLDEYFLKKRQYFDLPIEPAGTAFQQKVWRQLQHIEFGKTTTYLEIARAISGEKAIRAVGGANGKNPISIVVPCHRVIGSDGSLTGYAWNTWRKKWLLEHEGAIEPEKQMSLF